MSAIQGRRVNQSTGAPAGRKGRLASSAETAPAVSGTVRIESPSRWDALALTRNLPRYKWHLLQTAPDRWYVCVHNDGSADELPEDLLARVRVWLNERALPAAIVHLPNRDCLVEPIALSGDRTIVSRTSTS
jgi:hypothetical protein